MMTGNKISLLMLSLLFVVAGITQNYLPVDEAGSVSFSIRNFGVATTGSFSGLKGKISFDLQDPAQGIFDVSVDAATINTGIDARDNHLRKEAYFDVAHYPVIRFLSEKIQATGKSGEFVITGNLFIKASVKQVSFPFTVTPYEAGYLFKGAFELNRRDFKVGEGSLVLSDNLKVFLSVYAKMI